MTLARVMRLYFCLAICVVVCANGTLAQTDTGLLNGEVVDPSGGVVANATVKVIAPDGQRTNTKTDSNGKFETKPLPPGEYTVEVNVKGFTLYKNQGVELIPGQVQRLHVVLAIEGQQESITVSAGGPQVGVDAADSPSTLVIGGKQLGSLSDDPDQLQAELNALAGPSMGQGGGQVTVDGFTAGRLPPKAAIREIRINDNIFSADATQPGHGHIEIFTKPGADQWHGQFSIDGNDSAFNAHNPFATSQPPYESTQYDANVGGPLGKKASIFLDTENREINGQNVVSAVTLNSANQPVPFSQTVANPQKLVNIGPRLDYQITKNNTFSVRYQYFRNHQSNQGIGGITLSSAGYDQLSTEHTLQLSDDWFASSGAINELHFQYLRDQTSQIPGSTQPSISVLGAFTGGGAAQGTFVDNANRFELRDYASVVLAKHRIRFGGLFQASTDTNFSKAGFNGSFTFSTLSEYANGQPSQFSITVGNPTASVNMVDAGLYVEDNWQVRPNFLLSYGLRFETQNHINDHADWAPRFAIAWGIGRGTSAPKTVLRLGAGVFYRRIGSDPIFNAIRLNGVAQQQYIVANPVFYPNIPSVAMLQGGGGSIPTIYELARNLRAPYLISYSISIDRQLTRISSLSVGYFSTHGYDDTLTNNVNAPFPGTCNPSLTPSCLQNGSLRPSGIAEDVNQYQSRGISRENIVFAESSTRAGSRLTLNAQYALIHSYSDSGGFPSNPYNLTADYGRSAGVPLNFFDLIGTASLPFGFRLSTILSATSGVPFNVTLGQDLIGTSQFNQRPGLVSTSKCSVTQINGTIYCTPFGTFDSVPAPGEKIVPINYLTGPGLFNMNLDLSKTFGFGKSAATSGSAGSSRDSRYNITLSVNARNVFNRINLGSPIGNLSSPLFGQSNTLAGGFESPGYTRQIYLQFSFGF